jgi:YgiT-type zinc finger domain-containing protein
MKPPESPNAECPRCGGKVAAGEITYSAELGFGVVVVRHVPARVCQQCGEEWIEHHAAQRISAMVEEARKQHTEVAVLTY